MEKRLDKDQAAFIEHCRNEFGSDYAALRKEAALRHEQAMNVEPCEHKKHNAGLRAGNLYLLGELKKIGAEKWRPEKDGNKPKPKQIPRQALTQEQRQQYTAKPVTGFLDNELDRIYNKAKQGVKK